MLVPRDVSRAAGSGDPAARVVALSGETMGTSWSAKLAMPPGGPRLRVVRARVEAALAGVVAEMSQWEPESALSRFNRAAAGSRHALPDGLFAVLDHALALAEATGGAYDPTAGRLTELWGFGAGPRRSEAPSDDAIAAVVAPQGWRRVALDREARRALQPGGVALDLSSIAKGYGVDRMAVVLRDLGITNFLAEIGGELVGDGVKPDGLPWWVTIEPPPGATLPPLRIALHGLAVATSGDYRRFVESGGRRHAHTLDPRTGHSVDNGVASVTVVAGSAMAADAMATALTVLGADEGLRFASLRGVAAHFAVREADGWSERITPALAAMLD